MPRIALSVRPRATRIVTAPTARFGTVSRCFARFGALLVALAVIAGVVSCSSTPPAPPDVTYTPGAGAADVSPVAPIKVAVAHGTLADVALTNANGKTVKGALNSANSEWTASEPLGYGVQYTWSGTATGTNKASVKLSGDFTTVSPSSTTSAKFALADGDTVGIAAPIILQFSAHVEDKAAAQRALTITTDPPTEGSWGWLADGKGSRVHYRTKDYWKPGTKVTVQAKLYGVNLGDGAYGDSDYSLNITIGRSQIVKAAAPTHRMQVIQDGKTIFDFAVSYGEGNEPRNVTRTGIHVVSEKHEKFLMSNPPLYSNVLERWAVRISNNGEFIHANPETTGQQGAANVTNGCINLSLNDAAAYFPTAMYGDPVEVTGTSIKLSELDGDIYDWTYDWPTWQAKSALK